MVAQDKTFAQAWSAGEADLADLRMYVNMWQASASNLPIYAFWGVTAEQYAAWLEKRVAWDLMVSNGYGRIGKTMTLYSSTTAKHAWQLAMRGIAAPVITLNPCRDSLILSPVRHFGEQRRKSAQGAPTLKRRRKRD